jgi:hypothetical protein
MGSGSRVSSVLGVNRLPAERPKSPGSIPTGNQYYSPVTFIGTFMGTEKQRRITQRYPRVTFLTARNSSLKAKLSLWTSWSHMRAWRYSFRHSSTRCHLQAWSASCPGIFTPELKKLRYELHSRPCGPRNWPGRSAAEINSRAWFTSRPNCLCNVRWSNLQLTLLLNAVRQNQLFVSKRRSFVTRTGICDLQFMFLCKFTVIK